MANYAYPAIFQLCADRTYFVRFPDLPNAMTQGRTLEEAKEMAADVLRICLKDAADRGETPTEPSMIGDISAADGEIVLPIRAEV